ncbi:hypothetical protein VKT23_012462 [Stygiomarasmius scandens]|uniref:IRG-type G domain-containing protein n=1 Tax=Marasmiellus scandens TaxID=2682957 RepID=A0ABR1JBK0_9AGAR
MGNCASKKNPTMDDIERHLKEQRRKERKGREESKDQKNEVPKSKLQPDAKGRAKQMQEKEVTEALSETQLVAVEGAVPTQGRTGAGSERSSPVAWPTEEEYRRAREEKNYEEEFVHLAVAGGSGSGKSSLINAFRGVRNGSENDAAATGITETTSTIGRYPDPNYPEFPFVWYDVPGAGTLKVQGWEYFNQQGLFVFDAIIIVWNSRFTEIDLSILHNCARFRIPTFIVRSQSDTHLRNMERERKRLIKEDDRLDEEEKDRQLRELPVLVLSKYVTETRRNVAENLEEAGLSSQPVYLVSNEGLFCTVKDKACEDVGLIDEKLLVDDIIKILMERRLTEVYPAYIDAKNVLKEVKKNFSRLGTQLLPKRY